LSYFGAEMMKFEVKRAKKFLKNFDVLYAKIDSTTTTLKRGNTILNKETGPFSDTRDKLVVLHCALSRTILSFWPSGLAPAREEYGAPLT
jgi:hypothetical protein